MVVALHTFSRDSASFPWCIDRAASPDGENQLSLIVSAGVVIGVSVQLFTKYRHACFRSSMVVHACCTLRAFQFIFVRQCPRLFVLGCCHGSSENSLETHHWRIGYFQLHLRQALSCGLVSTGLLLRCGASSKLDASCHVTLRGQIGGERRISLEFCW
jgi:hypothetical protein